MYDCASDYIECAELPTPKQARVTETRAGKNSARLSRPFLGRGLSVETIGCILCGGAGNRVVIEENGYQGRRCDACGIIFVSPRPSREEVSAIYARDTAHVSSAHQLR